MKTFFVVLTFLFTALSQAASSTPVPASRAPQGLLEGMSGGANHLYIGVTPYSEGFGFGLGYEKDLGGNVGLGGQFTFLPEKDTPTDQAVGLISFGAQLRFHYVVQSFDLYVAPGFNLMMMELGQEDDTTVGASLAVGSLVQLSQQFAMGLEFSTFQPWFNDDFYVRARAYYITSSLTARLTF